MHTNRRRDTAGGRQHTPNRDGFALSSVVFAIAIMSIIVAAAVNSANDERRVSRATREATLATYAADAGLRQTYGAWPVAAVKALNSGDSLDLGWQNLSSGARFRTVIHRLDKNNSLQEYAVVVQGRRTGLNGGMSTLVGVVGGVPLLTYGVFTQNSITLSGGGLIDAYDSEVNAYNAAAPDSLATVWSNGTINIQKTTVTGDVGAVGAVTVGTQVNVTGNIAPNSAAVPAMDINACPAGGFTPGPQVPNGAGIAYNAGTGALSVAGGATLTLNGANYFFSQVVLSGNAILQVNPPGGSHTEIVVSDLLNFSGGTVLNLSASPTRLGFSSCGSPAVPSTWSLSGGAGSAFSVYAPNHPVAVSGGGDIYGAIVGSTYTAFGGSKLHYDEALARRPSDKLVVQKATWSMLPGN
jgi:hypothetical protein